ncbi:MAG TPA: alpha amylase C-terminal domain-containing protein [Coleofasciculaceae cyanobacterium]
MASINTNSASKAKVLVLNPKQQGYETTINVVNYLATHDREHLMRELGDRGIVDEAAFGRAKLAAVLLMTAMGVPMLWMGEEFGEDKRKSETVTQPQKIAWPLLERGLNRDLFEYYKKLIALRKQNPALQSDNIEFFHENPEAKVLAYSRWNEEGSCVIVVANFSDNLLTGYHIPNLPASGIWHEWLGGYDVEAGENDMAIDLPGYEARLFVLEQIEKLVDSDRLFGTR